MVLTIIFAILMFSVIIFVHELGHFMTARLFKVTVHEFAIGMGPAIFSKIKNGIKYSVRAIPIGGYCSMEGEDEKNYEEGSFNSKPWWQRFIILVAGALMNIILGFIICLILVSVTVPKSGGISSTTIDSTVPNSDASKFLKPGDKIVAVNGSRVNIIQDINFALSQNGKKPFEVTIKRGGEKINYKLNPYVTKYEDGTTAYIIGFTAKQKAVNVFTVIHESFFKTYWMTKLVFVSIGMLFSGQVGVNELSGPVGVVSTMNTAAQNGGFLSLLFLAGFITVNIGIMNLLPLPALDGGRILFVLIEAIRRKPIPPEKEGLVHMIGLVLLMGVMIFATWNDILRILK